MERPYNASTIDLFLENEGKMQYFLELFCWKSLNSIYHFCHFLVIKLYDIFCSWIDLLISRIINQVTTNRCIILDFYRDFSPCFLMNYFKLLFLDELCFLDVSFFYTVVISINLLKFFLMKSFLKHLALLFLKLSFLALKLQHLRYVHFFQFIFL